MITNQNEINKYKEYNKQYLPQDLINQNWIYQYNGDYIHIITNNNCYMNYNTQYCDCINYNWKTNVSEIKYACKRSDQYSSISYNSLSSDINYSERITNKYTNDKIILFGIFIIAIIFATMLLRERKSI